MSPIAVVHGSRLSGIGLEPRVILNESEDSGTGPSRSRASGAWRFSRRASFQGPPNQCRIAQHYRPGMSVVSKCSSCKKRVISSKIKITQRCSSLQKVQLRIPFRTRPHRVLCRRVGGLARVLLARSQRCTRTSRPRVPTASKRARACAAQESI